MKSLLLLLLVMPSCNLTEVQTQIEYEGPAEPLLAALSGDGPVAMPAAPLGNVRISYSTPSNKAITWLRNDVNADGSEVYREAQINTDHEVAAGARARDNARVENQTEVLSKFFLEALQSLAAQAAPTP